MTRKTFTTSLRHVRETFTGAIAATRAEARQRCKESRCRCKRGAQTSTLWSAPSESPLRRLQSRSGGPVDGCENRAIPPLLPSASPRRRGAARGTATYALLGRVMLSLYSKGTHERELTVSHNDARAAKFDAAAPSLPFPDLLLRVACFQFQAHGYCAVYDFKRPGNWRVLGGRELLSAIGHFWTRA